LPLPFGEPEQVRMRCQVDVDPVSSQRVTEQIVNVDGMLPAGHSIFELVVPASPVTTFLAPFPDSVRREIVPEDVASRPLPERSERVLPSNAAAE
jgi:hypothetical protein